MVIGERMDFSKAVNLLRFDVWMSRLRIKKFFVKVEYGLGVVVALL